MPVRRTRTGWQVKSAISGKWLKSRFPTKAKAESYYRTSKRGSRRVRHTRKK